MKTPLLLLLRAYKLGISPFLGQHCRFYPSCSEYAAEAIGRHGAWKGSLLAGKRLCKCHPWHAGGLDPVPELAPELAPASVAGLVSAELPPVSPSDSHSPTVAAGGCCSHS
jgi:putative membrane protein insertion efficiency factor